MFIIEDYPLQNPFYHSSDDTLDTLNLDFHAEVTRSLVAAIASISQTLSSPDKDNDGILNGEDNCSETPNGPEVGTCVQEVGGVFIGCGISCMLDDDCRSGESCQRGQGDCNANGIGDVCECYADFDCNMIITLADLIVMKQQFLRDDCDVNSCEADCNGDDRVNLGDLVIIKMQFLRSDCPPCP